MKQFNLFTILCAGFFALFISSCKNEDVSFPDFDYTTVYFAYQTPVRTIVLGDDTYDTSLDNAHKCEIYATMGGVYANKKKIDIDFVADNTLCNFLTFSDGVTPVVAMPSNYYTLGSSKISLDHAMQGAVGVSLTDAFFADPKSITNTYVIPLRMTNVSNADSILSGVAKIASAPLVNAAVWDVQPKNYVLYCVKFINPWHGNYLRRGKDVISTQAIPNIRHKTYVEYDEIASMTTTSLMSVLFPVKIKDASDALVTCNLNLTFDNQGNCTVSTATPGFTATGTGKFVKNGEKNSWANKDRNALYLSYNISMTGKSYATTDTLVARDRGVKIETFSPVYTK